MFLLSFEYPKTSKTDDMPQFQFRHGEFCLGDKNQILLAVTGARFRTCAHNLFYVITIIYEDQL